jgi:hypothetical protein
LKTVPKSFDVNQIISPSIPLVTLNEKLKNVEIIPGLATFLTATLKLNGLILLGLITGFPVIQPVTELPINPKGKSANTYSNSPSSKSFPNI